MANDPKAHCGNWCCSYNVSLREWEVTGRRGEREEVWPTKFCPETGERLTVVDGQPVVTPRPSPEYVALLEGAVRCGLSQVLPGPCLAHYREYSLDAPCHHAKQPIGCLRALAAERGKEE